MGVGRTRSVALSGMQGRMVEIEVDVSAGLPRTVLVGLPDTSLAESRDRCRAAVANSRLPWPDRKVTINLSPADLPKSGASFDLGIALAVLASQAYVPQDRLARAAVLGELALDGRLRAVAGVLPATVAAVAAGCEAVLVPEANAAEAALVPGARVVGVRSLCHAAALLRGEPEPSEPPVVEMSAIAVPFGDADRLEALDLADVVGQDPGRAALVVAAAGGHHLMLTGPPGVGKTMLAHRLPGLLPDLDHQQAMETAAVHSVAGLVSADAPLLRRPPFVDPHHTASAVALVGGGSRGIRPGAMSLAHHGVLFMDEAPEFRRDVLDALRQPLESGRVTISRAAQTATFPAQFQLVLAANPCGCGERAEVGEACSCLPVARRRYGERISAPVRDRIDLRLTLRSPSAQHRPGGGVTQRGTTERAQALVAEARARQHRRWGEHGQRANAGVPGAVLREHGLVPDAEEALTSRVRRGRANARSVDRVVRVAWTVADLLGHDRPCDDDVEAAWRLRDDAGLTETFLAEVLR
ncbi:magnesium chelatase family protein [Mumia flava]|uniref:Magnesium chelatase family protein n=1 Tax=Mumia flava TaxID=1348852 RepID=A0A2M9BEE9_9ACTN|nr:YifB family Mg chelatase-like AAA ATPase [Mumia flava]PJJ56316.1 magnesium chelatase family protein [Mumia flava]